MWNVESSNRLCSDRELIKVALAADLFRAIWCT